MNWEKIALICLILYLAIALPLYLLNNQAVQQCNDACSKEGFNIVLSAASKGQGIECRCFNSYGKAEKYITISRAG